MTTAGNSDSPMQWSEPALPHDGGPPTIKNHTVTYHKGMLYCFGGYDGTKNHMTLLIYSLNDRRWSTVVNMEGDAFKNTGENDAVISSSLYQVTGTPPLGRNGHTATLVTNLEGGEARIIIIGGWLGSGPLAASDMHILDISGGVDSLCWLRVQNGSGSPPGPCNMHSADFLPKRQEVFVFRGGNGREYLNDLHAFDINNNSWRLVETVGEAPQQRANHSSAVLEETQELFIFGGWNGKERLNDIHILDTQTSTWSRPDVGGVLPHPRAGMTLTALRGKLFLFGGSGTSSKCFCDLQILDRSEMVWLDVAQGTMNPSGKNTSPRNNGLSMSSQLSENYSSYTRFHKHTDWNVMEKLGMGEHEMRRFANTTTTNSAVSSRRNTSAANPNDIESVPTVVVEGRGPGRRAGHTATTVGRHIYVFGGSCGSDYLNDFFVLDTDPPPQAFVTESKSLQLVERRLRHFMNDPEFSDVTFIVEGKQVYGHRLVLATVSDCFCAMFTAGFKESTQRGCCEIEIPNCSYSIFLAMMEYIYTGNLIPIDVTAPNGIDRAVELLSLADLFILDHLKQECEQLLQPVVNSETLEYLTQVAQNTNAGQLRAICSHYQRNLEN